MNRRVKVASPSYLINVRKNERFLGSDSRFKALS